MTHTNSASVAAPPGLPVVSVDGVRLAPDSDLADRWAFLSQMPKPMLPSLVEAHAKEFMGGVALHLLYTHRDTGKPTPTVAGLAAALEGTEHYGSELCRAMLEGKYVAPSEPVLLNHARAYVRSGSTEVGA